MKMRWYISIALMLGVVGLGYLAYRLLNGGDNHAGPAESVAGSMRDSSATNGVSKTSKPAQTAGIANKSAPPKDARTFSAASLPAEQLPLVKSYEALKRSADEGNPFAACRLAADLFECSTHHFIVNLINSSKESLTGLEPASTQAIGLSNEIKSMEIDAKQSASLCEGFSNKDKIEPWKYQLQAALAGNVAAKAGFVIAPPVRWEGAFANIEFSEAYRGNAPVLLIEAANAGSRKAVEGAAWSFLGIDGSSVFQPGNGLRLLPRDPYKAALYFYASAAFPVAEQSHINTLEDLKQRVVAATTPEQREKAKLEANALVASWGLGRTDWLARADERTKKGRPYYGSQCED
jgi:hypothetical protein